MDEFKRVILTATYSSVDTKEAVVSFKTNDELTKKRKVSILNGEGAFLISEKEFKEYSPNYTLEFAGASVSGTLSSLENGKKVIKDEGQRLIFLSIQSICEENSISALCAQLDLYIEYLKPYESNDAIKLTLKELVAKRNQLFQHPMFDQAIVNASMVQEIQGSLGGFNVIKLLTIRHTYPDVCSRMIRKVLEAVQKTSNAPMDLLLTQLLTKFQKVLSNKKLYPLEKPQDNLITYDDIGVIAHMLFAMPKTSAFSLTKNLNEEELKKFNALSNKQKEEALIQDRLGKLLSSKLLKPDLLKVNRLDATLGGDVLRKLLQEVDGQARPKAQSLFRSEYTVIPITFNIEACSLLAPYIATNLIYGVPFIIETEAKEDREDSRLIFFGIMAHLLSNNEIRAACVLLNFIVAFMKEPVSGTTTRFDLARLYLKNPDMRSVTYSNKSAESSCDVLRNPYTALVSLFVTAWEKVNEQDTSDNVEEFTRACRSSLFSALRIGYQEISSNSDNPNYQKTRKELIGFLLKTVTSSVDKSVIEERASAFLKLVKENKGEDLGKALRSFRDEFSKQCNPYLHGTIKISDEIRKCCKEYFLEILSVDRGVDQDGYMLPKAPNLQTFLRIFLAAEILLSHSDVKSYLQKNDGYLSEALTKKLTKEIDEKLKKYPTITIKNIDGVLEKLLISDDDLVNIDNILKELLISDDDFVRMVTMIIALDGDNGKIFNFKLSEIAGQLSLSGLVKEEDLSGDQKDNFLKQVVNPFIKEYLDRCADVSKQEEQEEQEKQEKQEKLWNGLLSVMDMFGVSILPERSSEKKPSKEELSKEEPNKWLQSLSDPNNRIFELLRLTGKKSGIEELLKELLNQLGDEKSYQLGDQKSYACTLIKYFNVNKEDFRKHLKAKLDLERNKSLAEKVEKVKKDSKSMRKPVSDLLKEVLGKLNIKLGIYKIEEHNCVILTPHDLAKVWGEIESEDKHVLRLLFPTPWSLKKMETLSSEYRSGDFSDSEWQKKVNEDIEHKQGLEIVQSSRKVWHQITSEDKHVLRHLFQKPLSLKEMGNLYSKYKSGRFKEEMETLYSKYKFDRFSNSKEERQCLEILKSYREEFPLLIAARGSELIGKSPRWNGKDQKALEELEALDVLNHPKRRKLEALKIKKKVGVLCDFLNHLLKERNIELTPISGFKYKDEHQGKLVWESSELSENYVNGLPEQIKSLFKKYNIVVYKREGCSELIIHEVDSNGIRLGKITDLAKELTDEVLTSLKQSVSFVEMPAASTADVPGELTDNELTSRKILFSELAFFPVFSDTEDNLNVITTRSDNTRMKSGST
jgi:hypothetical protein